MCAFCLVLCSQDFSVALRATLTVRRVGKVPYLVRPTLVSRVSISFVSATRLRQWEFFLHCFVASKTSASTTQYVRAFSYSCLTYLNLVLFTFRQFRMDGVVAMDYLLSHLRFRLHASTSQLRNQRRLPTSQYQLLPGHPTAQLPVQSVRNRIVRHQGYSCLCECCFLHRVGFVSRFPIGLRATLPLRKISFDEKSHFIFASDERLWKIPDGVLISSWLGTTRKPKKHWIQTNDCVLGACLTNDL